MATIDKIKFETEIGASFLAEDSGLECAQIWNDGSTLWLVVGGQTRHWKQREEVWIHDRLPDGPHEDKTYAGYWAGEAVPSVVVATGLSVIGATKSELPSGWPLFRVAAAAPLIAIWDASNRAEVGTTPKPQNWRVELLNADTGEVIQTVNTNIERAILDAMPNGTRAILRVGTFDEPRGEYQWPPPNYSSITGNADFPSEYQWQHPTLGTVYYDPKYRVGARPYDAEVAAQAELLSMEAEYRANGEIVKVPEWVRLLVTFNADGSRTADDGEFSMLRLVVGDAVWNESSVREGATLPCLWRVPLDANLQPLGPVETWIVDSSLRMVGALEVGQDGSLLVGGACMTEQGPLPALLQIQKPDAVGDSAMGETTLSLFICECALPLGKGLRGLAQTVFGIRAVSPCDSFSHEPTRPILRRLVASHPGGRNATAWIGSRGQEYVFSTEGGDFATSEHVEVAFGFVVIETSNGRRTGAPLAKQLDSQLATFGNLLWGVEDDNPFEAEGGQYLCSSQTGATWSRVTSWGKMVFDGGVVCRIGSKRLGAGMWCFGWQPSSGKPLALRAQGNAITRHIDSDYFIQRANSFQYRGETWMAAIGLRVENDGDENTYSRLQHVLLSRGDDETAEEPDPDTPTNGDEGFEQMPDGTKISVTSFNLLGNSVSAAAFYASLIPDPALGVDGSAYSTLYPYSLWFRVDSPVPLQIESGAEVTGEIKAQLREFDQLSKLDLDRFLAIPAGVRIEALLLLAPDWSIESKNLKARF